MENRNIYQDIATRTDGDIYIGVVGPVRTGKSTFIKRFMDSLVIPNAAGFKRERMIDELPQSAAGRTIMTTEPKFIPQEGIELTLAECATFNVRLIDCVGYIVPSALGYIENDLPRMVKTPWFEESIPFNMAAEMGTQKVISEHSTIGLVITTDGSITDIPREEYEEAEERVIDELKAINKPFIVLFNCVYPALPEVKEQCESLSAKYDVPVIAVNCMDVDEGEIKNILSRILFEFPIRAIEMDMPRWVSTLEKGHWLRTAVYDIIAKEAKKLHRIREVSDFVEKLLACEHIEYTQVTAVDLGSGRVKVSVGVAQKLFYQILAETTGLAITNEQELMNCIAELAQMKTEYDKIKSAMTEVQATGYGIVMPTIDELVLEKPQIMKEGSRYGVKLKASAPSIHMMRADITTEVSPIVGSEKQSEDLVRYLMDEFDENPLKIWDSEIFGKSLHALVNEGLHNKLYHMPDEARMKLKETVERIINEGCSGLICILL